MSDHLSSGYSHTRTIPDQEEGSKALSFLIESKLDLPMLHEEPKAVAKS